MFHPSLAWLACLALACLAILASYRPRSPCLHQQQRPRREAPRRPPKAAGVVVAWCRQGERGRNEAMDSQASQGQARKPSQRWMVHKTLGSQPRWPPAVFSPEKQQPPKFGHAGLVKFGQILTKNDPKCSGPAMFVVILARAQPKAENIDFPSVFQGLGWKTLIFRCFFNIWAEVGNGKGVF